MFRGVVGKNTVKKLVRRDERRSPLSQLIQSARYPKEIRWKREQKKGRWERSDTPIPSAI